MGNRLARPAFNSTTKECKFGIKQECSTVSPEVDRIDTNYTEEHSKADMTRTGVIMVSSPTYAPFHLSYSLPGLNLAIFGDLLPGSLAKVGNVYHESSDGLSDP